jgi:hypothetical protein
LLPCLTLPGFRQGGYERLSAYRAFAGIAPKSQLNSAAVEQKGTVNAGLFGCTGFHANDPLAFNGGGKLLWWVGQCKPFGAEPPTEGGRHVDVPHSESVERSDVGWTSKCGNAVPDVPPLVEEEMVRSSPRVDAAAGRQLTPINVTTYGWRASAPRTSSAHPPPHAPRATTCFPRQPHTHPKWSYS